MQDQRITRYFPSTLLTAFFTGLVVGKISVTVRVNIRGVCIDGTCDTGGGVVVAICLSGA